MKCPDGARTRFPVSGSTACGGEASVRTPLFERGARVLFQGDSITDMGRGRNSDPNHLLGHGYVFIIAAAEAAEFPGNDVTFLNRGVSGNESGDLAARWKADALDLNPSVLSILIGVNDFLHCLRKGLPFSVDLYSRAMDQMLTEAVRLLPGVRLVIGEPFLGIERESEGRFMGREKEIGQMQSAVVDLAHRYSAAVVPYQSVFDRAAGRAPMKHWIWDGVHPTHAGHQIMADAWQRTFADFYGRGPSLA